MHVARTAATALSSVLVLIIPAAIVISGMADMRPGEAGTHTEEAALYGGDARPAAATAGHRAPAAAGRKVRVSPAGLEGQAATFVAAGLTEQRFEAAARASRASSEARSAALEERRRAAARKRAEARERVEATGPAGWIRACLRVTGSPEYWYAGLWTIARRESGFDPNAFNGWDANAVAGEPSRGLFQTTMGTFRAHHQPGTAWDINDPVANCAAAVNYIKAQYGDISRVQQADSGSPPKGY
ncbi:transglycosylase SLT domain-containing protein [Streptomyces sp. NPDC053542]|uniref:transglycosylase SLT domain-containing protein n=1 Tax=Streptomyces sp. NPDC053542 TaxID=3365710 RepID=UPI0037CD65D0